MSGVVKQSSRRPRVAEINTYLLCTLCGGYYVDAATIIECLHTFCKSCLVRYLETNKYCPICEVQVHKSRPLQNIRPDPTLQDMVYKLIPGLYHKEMKCRREFYSKRPDAPPSSLEDRGDIPPELSPFYSPDEPVDLVLEHRSAEVDSDPTGNKHELQNKRFLRCPAAVKITHLEKLLRNKYGLDNRYNIDLMLEDSKLPPDLTLMDVAYAFGRKRKGQFLFTYRIYDSQCKKMRLSEVIEMDTTPPSNNQVDVKHEFESAPFSAKLSSAEPSASTTSTTTTVLTSLAAPMVTTPAVTTPAVSTSVVTQPLSSAPISKPTNPPSVVIPAPTFSSTSTVTSTPTVISTPVVTSTPTVTSTPAVTSTPPVTSTPAVSSTPAVTSTAMVSTTPAVTPTPVVTPAPTVPITSTTGTSTAAATSTKMTPATSVVSAALTSSVTMSVTSTSTAGSQSAPSNPISSASTLLTTTAPSLTVSVQRLNPATIKSVTSPTVTKVEKTTNLSHISNTSSTDIKSKLDSIISRLGDPSKHLRPEFNSKKENPGKKLQGKEVQLRISENGEIITSIVQTDRNEKTKSVPTSPVPKPTPKVSHSAKNSENSTSSESAPKQGAVTPVSPHAVASPRKPGSSPVGYKTLKAGPKSWNPTISRNSFLSAKLEQQQQQQQQLQKAQQQNKDNSASGTKSPAAEPVVKPPRFFKARNTPRYLGNPASGVKPMYQIASPPPSVQKPPSKPPPKPPSKPPAVLKLDPKTLTPIMTPVSAATGSPPPQSSQAKDRPPFLSTTISGSNHLPSSRGVTTTSTTITENSSKMSSSDLALRNTTTPSLPYHMRLFSFCDSINHFSPRLGDPSRIQTPTPFGSLLSPPFSPLFVNAYGRPPVGMLYNQPIHKQVNHTGPLSPVPGLPSPLPPSSAPLSPSPSSTPKTVIPPVQWGPSSPSSLSKVPLSPHALPSKKPSTEVQPKTADKQTERKVNGEKSQVKDKSGKKVEEVHVKTAAEEEKKKVETKATSLKEKPKEPERSEQDNNNTVVIEKKSVKADEPVVEQSQSLSHNISKLCSPAPSGKESPAPTPKVENSDQVATVTVKQS